VEGKYYLVSGVFNRLAEMAAHRLTFVMPEILRGELIVVPVPLHVRRERWRGFNQSEVAATALAEALELTVQSALERTVHTKVQKDLHRQQRLENVRGVFRVTDKAAVARKQILLVDDVTTTGATLREATNALMSAGAAEVWCIAIARE
jgi:ComF family protein